MLCRISATEMRELVVILRRHNSVKLTQHCCAAGQENASVRLENNTLEKLPAKNTSDRALPRIPNCVEGDGPDSAKTKHLRVAVQRDPKLDRLALNGACSGSNGGKSNGGACSGSNGGKSKSKRRNFKERSVFRASDPSDCHGAIFADINKESFMSQLSLLPYHVARGKSAQTSAFQNRSTDLWRQIRDDRNLESSKRLRVLIARNHILDCLALQSIQSIDLMSLNSKVTECAKRLGVTPIVVVQRDSRLDLLAAESTDVVISTHNDGLDTPCPKQLTARIVKDPCIDRIGVRKAPSDSVHPEDEMESIVGNSKVVQSHNSSHPSTDKQQIVNIRWPSDSENPPLPRYPLGNTTGSSRIDDCNTVTPCAPTPSIKLRRITRNNWAVLQPSHPDSRGSKSPTPAGPITGTCSRDLFIELRRDSTIDRLALQDTASFCQPLLSDVSFIFPFPPHVHSRKRPSARFPPRTTRSKRTRSPAPKPWPQLKVEAQVHNENEHPWGNSIATTRSSKKILHTIRNIKKFKPCAKLGCCKNHVNSSEKAKNTISRYMAVKKPLKVLSNIDSINIDQQNTDSKMWNPFV